MYPGNGEAGFALPGGLNGTDAFVDPDFVVVSFVTSGDKELVDESVGSFSW